MRKLICPPLSLLIGLIVVGAGAGFLVAFMSGSFSVAEPDWEKASQQYWPQWRGPLASGTAPLGDPPTEWSESKNIRWKIPIPGHGSATPIVWGNTIFVQTAVPVGEAVDPASPSESQPGAGPEGTRRRGPGTITSSQPLRFTLLAIDRKSGAIRWEKTLRRQVPHASIHPTSSWASGSPVTDGQHVYAYFGSNGLYCLNLQGELIWEKDLGDMRPRRGFGEGSSPAIYGDRIIVNWDHEDQSFVVALDKKSGQELWRVERDEITSWTTPLIVSSGGRIQVITAATNRVRSYDFLTGQQLWHDVGMTLNSIPSPVYADGMVFVISGFRSHVLRAIRLGEAKGDISQSPAVAWTFDRDTPYVPSPLLYRGTLYFLKSNNAILTARRADDGSEFYGRQRLEGIGNVYASPVAANGRVYIVGRRGNAVVLKHGAEFELLATNSLDDGFDASPVIVGNEILLRGKEFLYSIAE